MSDDPSSTSVKYGERIEQTLRELGIPVLFATQRRESVQIECEDLVSIGPDTMGREQRMERRGAAQWHAMRDAAKCDAVELLVVSAFRSFEYQRQIVARKLAAGQTLERILAVSALPGFSEHHTGRALDLGTAGCPPLTEAFEQTKAYAWLQQKGKNFGFQMTYPRGNPYEVSFEPWHWFFTIP